MGALEGKNIFFKLWYFLRTYILTIPRFDLFLQGTLLIVTLLDANCYLLLRRDATDGKLPALIEDWVFLGTLGAEIMFGSLLSWYGSSRRNFTLSAWLAITAGSGLLVLAFPYSDANPPRVELCGGDLIGPINRNTEEVDSNAVPRQILLIITAVFCSLTRISIFSHGITYLDDHQPENGPYFYGILISIRLSLGLSGEKWLIPGSRRDDWYEAHVSLSMLTLMFSILYTLFPKQMPDYKPVEDTGDGFVDTLVRVLSNKQVIIQMIALSFLNAGLFGFIHYDAEFVQGRFHVESIREDPQSSRFVGDLMRSLVIIFFIAIFRMRFSVRRSDGVKAGTAARVGGVVAVLVAVFFAVLAILFCSTDDVSGMNGAYEQPSCSQVCGCRSEVYGFSPVCSLNTSTTYFSPCHAGCTEYDDLNGFPLFSSCLCEESRVVRGACSLPDCVLVFAFYQFFFAIILAVAGSSLLMQSMCIIRAVRRADKPLAVGATTSLIALSHLVSHALYMTVSNATCAFAQDGACLLHAPSVWSLAAISSGFALASAIVSLIASRADGDDYDHKT